MINYLPQNIPTTENMPTKGIVTSEHWNAILNLLISQGNNSSISIYNLIAALGASTGATDIGATPITGVIGTNTQAVMAGLKSLIDLCYTASATDSLLAQKETVANANQLVKTISFNSANGTFTITTQGGTVSVIDTALEKVAVNFVYDSVTQSLILTLADGSTTAIPLSAFIQENDFLDSSTVDFTITDHVVTANIKNGSITEAMLSSATLASLIGYKNAAETAATNAAASEANALTYKNSANASAGEALTSKSAAKISETNSKTSETNSHASEVAAEASASSAAISASQALGYRNEAEQIVGTKVTTFKGRSGDVLPLEGDYNTALITQSTALAENAHYGTSGAALDAFILSLVQNVDNNLLNKDAIGAINGVAGLDANGKIPATQVPASADTATTLSDPVKTALGLTGTKYVSDALIRVAPWRLLQAYTVAGSYTFIVPNEVTELGAFVVGGGGAGALTKFTSTSNVGYGSGGASGHTKTVVLSVPLSASYSLVVGAGGGAATKTTDYENSMSNGNPGGSSAFNGLIALGGGGGYSQFQSTPASGAEGGQGSSVVGTGMPARAATAFGDILFSRTISSTSICQQGDTSPNECINPFDGKKLLISGGGASYPNVETANTIIDGYGNYGSSGLYGTTTPLTTVKGTSYGCGGGAVNMFLNNTGTVTSAAGCDGAVLVYGR